MNAITLIRQFPLHRAVQLGSDSAVRGGWHGEATQLPPKGVPNLGH